MYSACSEASVEYLGLAFKFDFIIARICRVERGYSDLLKLIICCEMMSCKDGHAGG